MDALKPFHPSLQAWFTGRFAATTEVQARAWPRIAAGEHVLATAPTGSGKTLTAFLWALNQFAAGVWRPGGTRVLYVSPLKALNNDIQRNLMAPLAELQERHGLPRVRVQTRSGDTPQGERQRMLRQPPDILITTPESLMLLLTTARGRSALATVRTVILDEIHAVVDNRRGAQLMVSVERLARLAGASQRIALSATVRPLAAVAAYVGGYDDSGARREVAIIAAGGDAAKRMDLRIRFPEEVRDAAANGKRIWEPLSQNFKGRIEGNRATLLFTNSRRLAEKITLRINADEMTPIAYAHHGSLARDIRTEVERRLKAGEMKAIVATSSLEMGIDIGSLDEVLLVQTPPSIAAAVQRIGRAGHGVGEVSRGLLYPTHGQDLLDAAALAGAVAQEDIEPQAVMENPLDILCQTIVSMCADETWPVQEVFAVVRASAPYRRLSREHFDSVLELLAGRYAGARVRELEPRVALDRINGTVRSRTSAVFALYNGGGSIPDRGYYQLRHEDTGAVIGELDEEFVWEAGIGQTFTLGTQNWRILRITHNDVIVTPAKRGAGAPPFWRNESLNRSFHFAERVGRFLAFAEDHFGSARQAEFQAALMAQANFEEVAAAELCGYLERQRRHTACALPHRHNLLLEQVQSGPGGYQGPDAPKQLVIHSFWGGRLNRPWALALQAAWRQAFATVPEINADDNAIVVQCNDALAPERLLGLVTPENLDAHLQQALEGSGFFGARFRECAGRALLLTRKRFNQRLPLWMSRLQAKKLMTATKKYRDFPILLETWRTCLADEFDLPALRKMLAELQDGALPWTCVATATPSPFARNLAFDQISRYMYADDTPERDDRSALGDDLIQRAVNNEALRPRLRAEIVQAFVAKRQRRAVGYEPRNLRDWLEWAKERVLTPAQDWPEDLRHERLVRFSSAERAWVAHLELAHGLVASGLCAGLAGPENPPVVADPRTAADFIAEILSFHGPLTLPQIEALLPPLGAALDSENGLVAWLEVSDAFAVGTLMEGSDERHYCDADNFQTLLRFQRAASRAAVEAKPMRELPGFLAAWQGFGQVWGDAALPAMERLSGYPAPVATWLHDFLAARLTDFADHRLDDLVTREQFAWLGVGNRQITFRHPLDPPLRRSESTPCATDDLAALFLDREARYGYHQLADRAGQDAAQFNERWWRAVWAGEILADSLAPLRLGEVRKYRLTEAGASSRRRARAVAQGWPGNWRLNAPPVPKGPLNPLTEAKVSATGQLASGTAESSAGWADGAGPPTPAPAPTEDPLDRLEDAKERVRLLLNRYGFINREIVQREASATGKLRREMRWAALFKALRIMELAGEVIAGYFFKGLSGPQFITPTALHRFHAHRSPRCLWMSALDPASPCGLSLDWPELPPRREGHYLSFLDGVLALTIEAQGQRLHFLLPPEHENIDAIIAPLCHLAAQRKRIRLATINGQPARQSPYLAALDRTLTRTTDHRHVYYE